MGTHILILLNKEKQSMNFDHKHTFKNLAPFFVGFDSTYKKMADVLDQSTKLLTKYPPYNIKKTGDNTYSIELAVSGFSKSDLDIELDGDTLIIKGNSESEESDDNILYRGIANRAFTRQFKLAENIEIKNASLINGILKIVLDTIIPERNKVHIDIEEEGSK